MATLNVENKIVAFGDVAITNNPRLKYVDWFRTAQGISISKPVTDSSTIGIGDSYDVAGDQHQVSGDFYSKSIDSIDYLDTRTKIYGDFGTTVGATLTALTQIEVLVNGLVKFHFTDSLSQVHVGDCFYVKGMSTDDIPQTGVSHLNEGLWRVSSKGTGFLTCQKLDGCSGSISQTLSGASSIVVFRDAIAKKGNFLYVKEEGAPEELAKPLFEIIYADSKRIDIGFVGFQIDETAPITVTQNRYKFAYVEFDGSCVIALQTGTLTKSVAVNPIVLPTGEKIGWFQLTSDFNFIQVQNVDNQPIKVSAIVGG
jgi:hypothetical protein